MNEHAENGIENVVFDIGGVILHVDFMPAAGVFAKECGVTPREVLESVFPSRELEQYDRGRIEPDDFFRGLKSRFKIGLADAEVRRLWDDIFRENVPVGELIRGWHGKVPMYLISNTCRSHVEQFEGQFDLFGLFENRIYSCDVGLLKPEIEIFNLACNKFGVPASKTLYVDDKLENVEAARSVGFQAVHFEGNEQFFARLKELNLI